MKTQMNNWINSNLWITSLTSNMRFNKIKTIETKVIEVKSKDTLLTTFNNFYCGPEKNGKTSNVNVLTKYLGIKNGDKTTLKTDFISISKETLYNGFQLTLKIIEDDIFIVMKKNSTIELKCWSISHLTSFMRTKNPSITETNVRTLLLNDSLKVKFNVSEIKNHGTLWKASKK
jgi:hypothetical protein